MGQVLSNIVRVVPVLAPVDANGATKTGTEINMGIYDHVMFILQIGNIAGDATLTIEECSAAAGTGNTARAFNYRVYAAIDTDTIGAITAATSGGLTLANASYDNKTVVVEIDSSELTAGYPFVRVIVTPASAATLISCVAICSGSRYLANIQALS